MSNWAFEKFSKPPCDTCRHRWPNKDNPDTKIGDGCDCPECEYRPDLQNCYKPKEAEEKSN